MPDSYSTFVAEALRSRGFEVTHVDEGAAKAPDLIARKAGETFAIEVKCKEDDPRLLRQRDAALLSGDTFTEPHDVAFRNRLAGIVRHAVDQLDSASPGNPIRLLWFMGSGQRSRLYADQMAKTLFGDTLVVDIHDTAFQRQCYFFHESAFFRWRTKLDGAVVTHREGLCLCINPLSPRADRLRSSPLADVLRKAIRDPASPDAADHNFIVDCDLDRSVSFPVLKYVQQQLGRPMLTDVPITNLRVSVGVELDPEDPSS